MSRSVFSPFFSIVAPPARPCPQPSTSASRPCDGSSERATPIARSAGTKAHWLLWQGFPAPRRIPHASTVPQPGHPLSRSASMLSETNTAVLCTEVLRESSIPRGRFPSCPRRTRTCTTPMAMASCSSDWQQPITAPCPGSRVTLMSVLPGRSRSQSRTQRTLAAHVKQTVPSAPKTDSLAHEAGALRLRYPLRSDYGAEQHRLSARDQLVQCYCAALKLCGNVSLALKSPLLSSNDAAQTVAASSATNTRSQCLIHLSPDAGTHHRSGCLSVSQAG